MKIWRSVIKGASPINGAHSSVEVHHIIDQQWGPIEAILHNCEEIVFLTLASPGVRAHSTGWDIMRGLVKQTARHIVLGTLYSLVC
jgi:hypothetical protein